MELSMNTLRIGVMTTEPVKKSKVKKPPRSVKNQNHNAHFKLVMDAAKTVTTILKDHNIPCAVFGSLAAKLYGSSRCPKDVDIIISQPIEASSSSEALSSDSPATQPRPDAPGGTTPSASSPLTPAEIKEIILNTNCRNFYLKMPRDTTAEYRILWYRESYLGPECKVDILVPGIMHLPFISAQRTRWVDDVPLVPFSLLLLHKLQGWDDHRKAEEGYQQKKQQQDAGDVRKLMGLKREMAELKKTKPWGDAELFSKEFQELTRERVVDYCKEFPDRIDGWRFLGFEVPDAPVAVVEAESGMTPRSA